jgi:ATP-dependent helicase/nuclease subunit A
MVGDPQQSIYRFRGADIGVFTAVAGALGRQAPLADGTPSVVAAGLSTNFRSDPDMLDWVNAAFGTLIREETGIQPAFQALDVRPDAPAPRSDAAVRTSVPRSEEGLLPPLSKAREAALARASAGPTSASATPAAGPAVFSFDAATDEGGIGTAQNAARAIAHLVQDPPQVTAKKNLQATAGPLRPQDVAVLLRSRGPLAALEDALDGLGIEYRAEASTLIYATTEVRELKLILQAVANTADSGRLALALRTSILGCGDDDLASWKLAGGSWNIHARLPESLGTAAQQPPHPVARALAELQDLARLARVQTPADLLEHLVDTHLVHAVVTDSPRHRDLSRRLTYVIDQARAWFADTHGSLRDYLDWIDREDTDQAQDSETVLDEQDSSAVRILTVHAAKGLEFPAVVLLTGTQTRNDRPAVHWDQDTVPHLHLGSGLESTGYEDAHTREKYALDSEILRLMYVGCTRAEHLLPGGQEGADAARALPRSGVGQVVARSTRVRSGPGTGTRVRGRDAGRGRCADSTHPGRFRLLPPRHLGERPGHLAACLGPTGDRLGHLACTRTGCGGHHRPRGRRGDARGSGARSTCGGARDPGGNDRPPRWGQRGR